MRFIVVTFRQRRCAFTEDTSGDGGKALIEILSCIRAQFHLRFSHFTLPRKPGPMPCKGLVKPAPGKFIVGIRCRETCLAGLRDGHKTRQG